MRILPSHSHNLIKDRRLFFFLLIRRSGHCAPVSRRGKGAKKVNTLNLIRVQLVGYVLVSMIALGMLGSGFNTGSIASESIPAYTIACSGGTSSGNACGG